MPEQDRNAHQIKPFRRNRQLVLDAGWIAHRRHMIHGLIEKSHPPHTIKTNSYTEGEKKCLPNPLSKP
jgi:hypothetical protein